MQIHTSSFQLRRDEYFWIITSNYFQRRLWFYILIYSLLILSTFFVVVLKMPIRPSYIAFLMLSILVPAFYFYWFWKYSGSKENSIFYRKRSYNITEDFLEATLDDGSFDKINWQNILYYKKTREGFCFYFSKQQFIYIPNRIFISDNDLNEFVEFVSTKFIKRK